MNYKEGYGRTLPPPILLAHTNHHSYANEVFVQLLQWAQEDKNLPSLRLKNLREINTSGLAGK